MRGCIATNRIRHGCQCPTHARRTRSPGWPVLDPCGIRETGFAVPDLSASMDAESAHRCSLRLAREFTACRDYFDVKAFGYFPRDLTLAQFQGIAATCPQDELPFSPAGGPSVRHPKEWADCWQLKRPVSSFLPTTPLGALSTCDLRAANAVFRLGCRAPVASIVVVSRSSSERVDAFVEGADPSPSSCPMEMRLGRNWAKVRAKATRRSLPAPVQGTTRTHPSAMREPRDAGFLQTDLRTAGQKLLKAKEELDGVRGKLTQQVPHAAIAWRFIGA